MRIPIAREGLPFFLPPLLAGAALLVSGWAPLAGCLTLAVGLFLVSFFRDPERRAGGGAGSIVAPADGRVVRAVRTAGGGAELSIFLSPLDVHINRAPVGGKLERVEYRPGRYRPAYLAAASSENEQTRLLIDGDVGPVEMVQITGVLVRRIVLWKKAGERLERGERIGLMKFGSRVDLVLPPGVELKVSEGAVVRGAETVLAEGEPLMRLVNRAHLRRGVLILPSLFTLGNLFCGVYALMEATKGRYEGAEHFERAALFIAIAMVLDGLDGKVARLAHATSPLGMQLDSLADVVSFGVAPGILAYTWALADLGRLGWAGAFVFVSCGALRLARFNVLAQRKPDNRYFVGLPIPGGAAAVASLVYLSPGRVEERTISVLALVWTVLVALLMVSTFRYRSLKQVDLTRRQPLRTLLWVVLVFAVISSWPEVALASAAFLYTLSGPLLNLLARLAPSAGDVAPVADGPGAADEAHGGP